MVLLLYIAFSQALGCLFIISIPCFTMILLSPVKGTMSPTVPTVTISSSFFRFIALPRRPFCVHCSSEGQKKKEGNPTGRKISRREQRVFPFRINKGMCRWCNIAHLVVVYDDRIDAAIPGVSYFFNIGRTAIETDKKRYPSLAKVVYCASCEARNHPVVTVCG